MMGYFQIKCSQCGKQETYMASVKGIMGEQLAENHFVTQGWMTDAAREKAYCSHDCRALDAKDVTPVPAALPGVTTR